jgi:hypothetical protein
LDFFLAYHHDDNILAGKIKRELEQRGSTAFLAHEDIEISKTWREEILEHLKSCQALIAVVTPSFEKSTYANQEAGIILGKGKPVISLNFTKELPGFLESIQAIHASETTIEIAVEKAIKVIQGREPSTYIEPAFKTSQEIEGTAIEEIVRHIQRTEGRTRYLRHSDVSIRQIVLNDEKGVFELSGGASYSYSSWSWSLVVDARTGRILSKGVHKVQ